MVMWDVDQEPGQLMSKGHDRLPKLRALADMIADRTVTGKLEWMTLWQSSKKRAIRDPERARQND